MAHEIDRLVFERTEKGFRLAADGRIAVVAVVALAAFVSAGYVVFRILGL